MFPQATVRWPQAFNICAINSVVVVLPFVPVMPMTGTRQNCQPSSSSPIVGNVLARKISAERQLRIDPGAEHAEIVKGRIFLRGGTAKQVNAFGPQRLEAGQLFFRCAVEHRDLGAFLREEERGGFSAPARAEHRDVLVRVVGFHRSFRVARPRSAKMIERIQNRTITVFSFQPLSSK